MSRIIRAMTADELPLILSWAAAEGWNPGLEDVNAFLAADPAGFFLAEVDKQPVAAISVVNHSDDFAHLGLYICRSEYRGQGHGFALWQAAVAHAGARSIGLDGVVAQQANYARSGFVAAFDTYRHQVTLDGRSHVGVTPVAHSDVVALLALDADVTGLNRGRFMAAWLNDTATRKTLVLRDGDGILGFATIRACEEHAKIGPFIAPDVSGAQKLVEACAYALNAPTVLLDLVDGNAAAQALADTLGSTASFVTARMYRGTAPSQDTTRLFAIATRELG